ncbi:hypothetical protein [Streptomyces nigrescens]|uniref:hypothetical protein n=1 Tax=Streptomyces nigrescens TaxID=1920 RepID=UPI003701EFAF
MNFVEVMFYAPTGQLLPRLASLVAADGSGRFKPDHSPERTTMTSFAISLLPRIRLTLGRSAGSKRADQGLPQDDAWKAIAFAVDRAAADVLPLSATGTPDVVAGNRALASLVGGRFLLERIHERNERHIGEARTLRERIQRRGEADNLRPYLKAFRKAIDYARTVADGHPASVKLPALLQPSARLPLIQRFRQDRQVLQNAG